MIRIGTGYDVHRLVPERKLILCGVEVPCELGLLGHSDADVAVHALMDAILGALAMGDIGKLFPDSAQKGRRNLDKWELGKIALRRSFAAWRARGSGSATST